MRIIYQTDTIWEEMKIYGINFFTEKDTMDKNDIPYKAVYAIGLCFNTKMYTIGIGTPIKATE